MTFFCWVALSALLALYTALFVAAMSAISDTVWKPFVGGALWVTLESIRGVILTGFPWALLSHTQAYQTSLIQISSVTGAAGVSFLLAAGNVALAQGITDKQRSFARIGRLGVVLIIVGAVAGFGWFRLQWPGPDPEKTIKVAVLQGNIDQYQKWDALYESQIRKRYAELAANAMTGEAQLIVWPESALPGWFPVEPLVEQWTRAVVNAGTAAHLIGSITRRNGNEFNSLFLLEPRQQEFQVYDKQHLVPFGEYVPLGRMLKPLVPYLGQLGEFDAGHQTTVFGWNGIRIAANICYEAIFPELVRKTAINAQMIVNVTNDGWFLDTGAPEQHYVTNIFRAVETGRPVIRAANTGVSAVIDERGRELVRSPLLVSGTYQADLDIPSMSEKTFFLKRGPIFEIFCWLLVLFFVLVTWRRHRL